jgi:hypothetical protein
MDSCGRKRSLCKVRNIPPCLEMPRKNHGNNSGWSIWITIANSSSAPKTPAKPFVIADFINKTWRHISRMKKRLKIFICNRVKNELSWSGQICFKVAYIYTDVTGMINSLETGLESKTEINWYPSCLATCHAAQRTLKINTDRVSNKTTTSSPHTKQHNFFCPKASDSSRFTGLLLASTKVVIWNAYLFETEWLT